MAGPDRRKNKASNSSGKPPAYAVGFGKPPVSGQFKRGYSGNPRGRPKGTKNLKIDLAEELAERVQISENGRQVKVSKQRLVIKALTARAIKGDARSASILIGLIGQVLGLDPHDDTDVEVNRDDALILEEFIKHASDAQHRSTEPDRDK